MIACRFRARLAIFSNGSEIWGSEWRGVVFEYLGRDESVSYDIPLLLGVR